MLFQTRVTLFLQWNTKEVIFKNIGKPNNTDIRWTKNTFLKISSLLFHWRRKGTQNDDDELLTSGSFHRSTAASAMRDSWMKLLWIKASERHECKWERRTRVLLHTETLNECDTDTNEKRGTDRSDQWDSGKNLFHLSNDSSEFCSNQTLISQICLVFMSTCSPETVKHSKSVEWTRPETLRTSDQTHKLG